MADKGFGVKELNLISGSGTPTIQSPSNLNLTATTVAISSSLSTQNNALVGIDTGTGVVLKSANGTSYRLFVENDGTLKTIAN
tara:strand:+ start:1129 stop:1377 length:249 start_codon:yes stop_codon:yes gene_type:complete